MIKTEIQLSHNDLRETTFIEGQKPEAAAPGRLVSSQSSGTGPSPQKRDLRKFGLLVGIVLLTVGLLLIWRARPSGVYLTAMGITLCGLGVVYPTALTFVYKVWMALALFLAKVNTFVLITLLYFMVMTPMALLLRLLRKDILNLKLDPKAKSYWEMRESRQSSNEEHFTNQF